MPTQQNLVCGMSGVAVLRVFITDEKAGVYHTVVRRCGVFQYTGGVSVEAAGQHALGPESPEEEKGKQQCNLFTQSKGHSLGQGSL